MIFPFPFSIFASIVALGLIVAMLIKNQNSLSVTLLAFIDIILKLHWIFLLAYLLLSDYQARTLVPLVVISYCLFANLVLNLVVWQLTFRNLGLTQSDPLFLAYSNKYPCLLRTLLFLSFTVSFHVFRLSYSRFLGKKCFSANFSF